MAETPSPSAGRMPSGIPVPINKRSSLSFGNAVAGSSRAASPNTLSAPGGRKTPNGVRRESLQASSRRPSSGDTTSDDPAKLRSQIASLQLALASAHERMVQMTAELPLTSSTSTRPESPANGVDLPTTEGHTALADLARADGETAINGHGEHESSKSIARLPHSSSSYDLRSSAATPGKIDRKVSDGPLGISRIPQSAVTHGLVLHATPPAASPSSSRRPATRASPTPPQDNNNLRSPFPDSPHSPLHSEGRLSPNPPHPTRRTTSGSAASTRVIDGLQTDLINSRGHVEKLKQEVRANQRLIGSLTRQNEDLKETKERMRVECEGLNNVIARKERLLQEILERARTAEGSLAQYLATKKALEQSTKKSLQEMQAQVTEARGAQTKAESESSSLRDGVRSLKDAWARDLKAVKEEMKRQDEKGKKDIEEARNTHLELVKLVEAQKSGREGIQALADQSLDKARAVNAVFEAQIADLRAEVSRSADDATQARETAAELAAELAHLRRLMREPRRASSAEANDNDNDER